MDLYLILFLYFFPMIVGLTLFIILIRKYIEYRKYLQVKDVILGFVTIIPILNWLIAFAWFMEYYDSELSTRIIYRKKP